MSSKNKREPGFEQDLERLEHIVSALEEGGLSLEESLKQFEAGIRLTRNCEKALREAERKIEILTQSINGTLEAQPFDEAHAEQAASLSPRPDADAVPPAMQTQDADEEPADEPQFEDEEDLDALF